MAKQPNKPKQTKKATSTRKKVVATPVLKEAKDDSNVGGVPDVAINPDPIEETKPDLPSAEADLPEVDAVINSEGVVTESNAPEIKVGDKIEIGEEVPPPGEPIEDEDRGEVGCETVTPREFVLDIAKIKAYLASPKEHVKITQESRGGNYIDIRTKEVYIPLSLLK